MSLKSVWDLGASGDLDYTASAVWFTGRSLRFKLSPRLLQFFSRMLQRCYAVKLQKCFVSNETSPDFPSAWGEEIMTEFYFVAEPFVLSQISKLKIVLFVCM